MIGAAGGLPPWCERQEVTIAPGAARPYDPAEWDDALVVVHAGGIELEGVSGRRDWLVRGAVLWLAGLPLRRIANPGDEPAVLVAFRRRV